MRKNKKLLLASIAAMGALAIGVGATSTFAWFQAQTLAGQAAGDYSSTSFNVSNPNYAAAAVDIPVNVTITRLEADGDTPVSTYTTGLELGHYYAASDLNGQKAPDGSSISTSAEGLWHAYYKSADANSIVYTQSDKDGLDSYASYKVEIDINFPAYNADGVAASKAALNGEPGFFKPDGASSGKAKYQDSDQNEWSETDALTKLANTYIKFKVGRKDTSGSRAMFYGVSHNTSVKAKPTAAGSYADVTVETAVQLANSLVAGTKYTAGYFGLYVDGMTDDGSGTFTNYNDTTVAVSGDFTVVVAGNPTAGTFSID